MKSRLILVGGFLGAGKTTLLAEAARVLATHGQRVGLITNDQAPELVDTAFLSLGGTRVEEVSGSCFCCNFPGLLGAMAKLRSEAMADVLIAEPVGSCTDLSATIIQPLRDLHHGEIVVAPLSVLTDPIRLEDILNGGNGGLHPSAAYIFRKQMEEADILVISKSDLLASENLEALTARVARELPLATVFCVSAKTGVGLEAWLEAAMARTDAGQRLAEVDYDTYAEGEAVLGWLNATFALSGDELNWHTFAGELLNALSARFDSAHASVGHVKIIIESAGSSIVGNITGRRETVSVRGPEIVNPRAKLTLNARVEMSPASVEQVVREALDSITGDRIQATTIAWRCLSPGRPMPTHRYDRLIALT
jgi:G3E family GTPase